MTNSEKYGFLLPDVIGVPKGIRLVMTDVVPFFCTNLVKGAIFQLIECKVANIFFERYNTYMQDEKFFSYRRDGAKVGEMLMFFIL